VVFKEGKEFKLGVRKSRSLVQTKTNLRAVVRKGGPVALGVSWSYWGAGNGGIQETRAAKNSMGKSRSQLKGKSVIRIAPAGSEEEENRGDQ